MTTASYVGIDTSKKELEIAIGDRFLPAVENTEAGIANLAKCLQGENVEMVIIESTGIYSQLAANVLTRAGYKVAVVQPGRVRNFAKSQGTWAKTDKIDARNISHYGAASAKNLVVYVEPSEEEKRLRALSDRRDQLVKDRIREKGRMEACRDTFVLRDIRRQLGNIERAIKRIEKAIREAIKACPEIKAKTDVLEAQKGVAAVNSVVLLTYLPELGKINRQKIATLAGMAPFNDDSGPRKGKRSIFGGRGRVRRALYIAALSAIKYDDILKNFYTRLLARGKEKMVALIAVGRKILIRLNSLMREYLANQDSETALV